MKLCITDVLPGEWLMDIHDGWSAPQLEDRLHVKNARSRGGMSGIPCEDGHLIVENIIRSAGGGERYKYHNKMMVVISADMKSVVNVWEIKAVACYDGSMLYFCEFEVEES